jgi:hypothetical protein
LHIVDKLPLQFKATHADNNPDDSLWETMVCELESLLEHLRNSINMDHIL